MSVSIVPNGKKFSIQVGGKFVRERKCNKYGLVPGKARATTYKSPSIAAGRARMLGIAT